MRRDEENLCKDTKSVIFRCRHTKLFIFDMSLLDLLCVLGTESLSELVGHTLTYPHGIHIVQQLEGLFIHTQSHCAQTWGHASTCESVRAHTRTHTHSCTVCCNTSKHIKEIRD